MTTIIKNFTPAKTCWQCRFLTDDEWRCLAADRHIYKQDNPKPSWCPIVEGKHGRWEWNNEDEFFYSCSNCGHKAYGNTNEVISGLYAYCPNCGALMENEDERD